jgi:hypothetical protein
MAVMDPMTAPQKRLCGAKNRQGNPCARPAGWGTSHAGAGLCKLHGGSSPGGVKAAARTMAQQEWPEWAQAIEMNATDVLLQCVFRAAGLAAFFRMEVAHLEELPKGEVAFALIQEREELDRAAKFSKMAIDAGVAERQVKLAERTGELIAAAMEDALADVDLPADQRGLLAAAFARRLQTLEQTVDIEGDEA